jgi:hypothetical protein
MSKSGERKRLEILMLERERRGMRVRDLERKKERVWRERGKKGESERETYKWIQGMRKKK